MAKIDVFIPEPTPVYDPSSQRQILQALTQIKDRLNNTYQQEINEDLQTFNWFLFGSGS